MNNWTLWRSKPKSMRRCRRPKTKPPTCTRRKRETAKRSRLGGNGWVLRKPSTSTKTGRRPPNALTPWHGSAVSLGSGYGAWRKSNVCYCCMRLPSSAGGGLGIALAQGRPEAQCAIDSSEPPPLGRCDISFDNIDKPVSKQIKRAASYRDPIEIRKWLLVLPVLNCLGCGNTTNNAGFVNELPMAPRVATEPVSHDADDPAIWRHPTDPTKSLILGTDKDAHGALYVFNLQGLVIHEKVIHGLKRPNNVDVEYGLVIDGMSTDIAISTEAYSGKIRIHSLPDLRALDNGGIDVFEGEPNAQPMGIALYKRPKDGAIFAIVSRKKGPTDGTYLWQYHLEDNGKGKVRAVKARAFGNFSGRGEIEAIAVDDALGYVYCSDEHTGIRKYAADPDSTDGGTELALFGTTDFARDREGIAIYETTSVTGYVIVSDQGSDTFHFYPREGEPGKPHQHRLTKRLRLSTHQTDGIEATSMALGPNFPKGLLVAMSDDRTFHLYAWETLAQAIQSSGN